MLSIGIDNIEIIKRVSDEKLRHFRRQLQSSPMRKSNEWVLIADRAFVRIENNALVFNINVPKLAFGHNVLLGTTSEIQHALSVVKKQLPIDVDVQDFEVRRIDCTFAMDTNEAFATWKQHLTLPKRGKWKRESNDEWDGEYFNSSTGQQTLIAYDSLVKLRKRGEVIPLIPDLNKPYVLRLELRLQKKVRGQLSRAGLWLLPSFRAKDLTTEQGFLAVLQYFEKQIRNFVYTPKKPAPIAMHCERSASLRGLMLSPKCGKLLIQFHKEGTLSDTDLESARFELYTFRASQMPYELLEAIRESVSNILKNAITARSC